MSGFSLIRITLFSDELKRSNCDGLWENEKSSDGNRPLDWIKLIR